MRWLAGYLSLNKRHCSVHMLWRGEGENKTRSATWILTMAASYWLYVYFKLMGSILRTKDGDMKQQIARGIADN